MCKSYDLKVISVTDGHNCHSTLLHWNERPLKYHQCRQSLKNIWLPISGLQYPCIYLAHNYLFSIAQGLPGFLTNCTTYVTQTRTNIKHSTQMMQMYTNYVLFYSIFFTAILIISINIRLTHKTVEFAYYWRHFVRLQVFVVVGVWYLSCGPFALYDRQFIQEPQLQICINAA